MKSAANLREHHFARHRRVKAQRTLVHLSWPRAWKDRGWRFPLVVELLRVAPHPLDDDNLSGAFKSIRDQVAKELGLKDDRDPRVKWDYAQERGPYAVRIAVEEGA